MSDQSLPAVTRDSLAADHPALLAAIEADATANGYQAGQLAERTRVRGILEAAAAVPHARALADAAIAQGLTAEQAVAMLAAAPEPFVVTDIGRDEFRAALLAEGMQQAPTADTATGEPEAPTDPEQAAKAKWESDAALRAEFSGDFSRWQAFTKAKAAGRVKILRK